MTQQYEVLEILTKNKDYDYVSSMYIKNKTKSNNVFRMIRSLEKTGFVVIKKILRADGRIESVVGLVKDAKDYDE